MSAQEMPTAYAIMLVRDALEQGENLLQGLNISMEAIEKKEYFPLVDYMVILDRYTSWNNEIDWGFSFGHRLGIATHGALGFGAMSARTVKDGLAFLSRYLSTRVCHTHARLVEADDAVAIYFDIDSSVLVAPRRSCESLSMVFQTYIEAVGARSAPTLWHFPYQEPEDSTYYTRWLHGGFRFGSEQLVLEVPGSVCMVVSAFHNESVCQSSIAECEKILSERTEHAAVTRVRQLLATAYKSRISETEPDTTIPDADKVAKEMGISTRTLIRKLREGDTTFQNVRDGLLREHARQLFCQDNRSLIEIGHRLGYQDAGNFTRACKRLFGESPSTLRNRLTMS
jgi:AraC-like DNA-binding protein